jgi:hypothetical protein
VNRARWIRTIEAGKKIIDYQEGYVEDDKFQALAAGDALAHVSTTYTRGLPYGEEKVSVMVSVACDQNEATINKAGEHTFMKALELVGDGFSVLEQLRQMEKKA